jgi:hypothetical protein
VGEGSIDIGSIEERGEEEVSGVIAGDVLTHLKASYEDSLHEI